MSELTLMEVLKLARGQMTAVSLVLDEAIETLQEQSNAQARADLNSLGRAHDSPGAP